MIVGRREIKRQGVMAIRNQERRASPKVPTTSFLLPLQPVQDVAVAHVSAGVPK